MHLCRALYQMICAVAAPENTVGADQFVYFDASNPKRCLEPDAFVTMGVPDHDFGAYLTWEEGTPTLAFEVLNPSGSPERWTFEEKLRRYHSLGVRELVGFFMDDEPGKRLRVWDRIEHDLVERVVADETTPCITLGLTLLVGPVDEYAAGLRLSQHVAGGELISTDREAAAKARVHVRALESRIADLERALAASKRESRPTTRARRRET